MPSRTLMSARFRRLSFFLVLLLSLALDFPARAQHGAFTRPARLDQLVQSAQTIFIGHVLSARVEPHPQFAHLRTVIVTVSVSTVLKGEPPATFSFRQYIWDTRDIAAAAGYRKTQELLLFLNPVSEIGLTSPVGLEQGRFRVSRDAKGNSFAVNGRGNLGLFAGLSTQAASRGAVISAATQSALVSSAGPVPLRSLQEAISALVGASK